MAFMKDMSFAARFTHVKLAFVQQNNRLETGRNMKAKALIVVTSNDQLGQTGRKTGWYLSEVTHVYYALVDAGFAVDFASPRGGAAPMDEGSRKQQDPENQRFLADADVMARIARTMPLAQIDPRDYAVLHVAGGHGVMWDLPADRDLQRVTAGIFENGGVVAAVCHGPAALVDVKLANGTYLVAGRDVSGFTNAEEEAVGLSDVVPFLIESTLKDRGARFHGGAAWQSHVSVSGRLVTGQNPQSARAVAERIVAATAL
jgi:putative intracellular protease/amidase